MSQWDSDTVNDNTNTDDASTAYMCGACKTPVTNDQKAVLCEECDTWFHIYCQGIPSANYSKLDNSNVVWACLRCHTYCYSHIQSGNTTGKTTNSYDTLDTSIESLSEGALPKYESSPKKNKRIRNKAMPLKLLNINCQSIIPKIGEWRHLLNTHQPDIVVATETWLKPEIFDAELDSDDYLIYRRDRTRTTRGGVLIAVHKTINSTIVNTDHTDAEIIWVKLMVYGQQHIILGACYRPDVNDKTTMPEVKKSLDKITNNQHRNVILAGDFNFPGWDWAKLELKPNCQQVQLHEEFKTFLDDNGMVQEVTKPTREKNILDLVATNIHERVIRTEILPGISDHNAVLTEISMSVNRRRQAPHKIWLYKRADWVKMAEYVESELGQISNELSVNNTWLALKRCITDATHKFIPSKHSKNKKSKPYISADLERKIILRDRLDKVSKKTGKIGPERRYKHLKHECRQQLRREHNQYVENLLTDEQNPNCNGKKFWSYLRSKRGDNCGIGTLRDDDKLVTNPTEKAELLNHHFHSVFTPISGDPPRTHDYPEPTMQDFDIRTEGVLVQLKKLNPHKATGPDDIGPRVLKELADVLAAPLANLFQKSLDKSEVPDDWRKARVTPLFKKGDRYLAGNYRPISLTCVTCKILEHIVTSQLTRFLETNDKLSGQQHGFRSHRSCESQLTELTCDLSKEIDEGSEIDAVFLDFSKAFDKVDHTKLIHKLRLIGASEQVSHWVEALLHNRSQVVVVDGHASTPCKVTSGVPQGSVVGPILFLVYINDLPNSVVSTARLFADDTVIYNTTENRQTLQNDLEALEKWEIDWNMQFNPSKCEFVKFSRKKSHDNNTYLLHGIEIPRSDGVKYLGIKLENSLKWNKNTAYITNKAASRLGYIRRTIPHTLPHLRNKAFTSLVRPILEYSSTVWDGNLTKAQATKIESIQRKAARIVNNIPRTDHTTSTTQLIKELEWQTLNSRRERRRLGFFRAMHFGEVATDITHFIDKHPHAASTRKHSHQYLIPHCRTELYKKSFFVSTAKLWNNLPVSSSLLIGPPMAG